MREAELLEKAELPISVMMIGLNSEKIRSKGQVSFIDFVLSPLWTGIIDIFPEINDCIKFMRQNR